MATQRRRIVGGITQGTKTYKEGDEDALAKVLSQRAIQRLLEKGQLEGEWGVPVVVRGPVDAEPAVQPKAPTLTAENFSATTKAEKATPARKSAVKKTQLKKGR